MSKNSVGHPPKNSINTHEVIFLLSIEAIRTLETLSKAFGLSQSNSLEYMIRDAARRYGPSLNKFKKRL